MARRVSWTNNSSGHSGTYVYRAETLDPQNLPAPVATVDPVAQGATAEWVDSSGEYGCFAVQDFDGQGVGALSEEVCVTDPFDNVQIGDEIEGGIYAGIITYADSREYHILAAKQEGESSGIQWGNMGIETGAADWDDGMANQNHILSNYDDGNAEVFYHARDYAGGGKSDWYVPARNELLFIYNNLVAAGFLPFSGSVDEHRWSSSEDTTNHARVRSFEDGGEANGGKDTTFFAVRPIRRVAV